LTSAFDWVEDHGGLPAPSCVFGYAKALKKVDAVSHGEGSQKLDDKNHRVENLQVGLKHFVLEFSPEMRS